MVDRATVHAIAAASPGVVDDSPADRIALSAGGEAVAWTFMERVNPNRSRVPRPDVLAVRCPIERKQVLLEVAPQVYFDDPHYRGYPAVLVRLGEIEAADLKGLLEAAAATPARARKRPRNPSR